jgi:hypothetical protein
MSLLLLMGKKHSIFDLIEKSRSLRISKYYLNIRSFFFEIS